MRPVQLLQLLSAILFIGSCAAHQPDTASAARRVSGPVTTPLKPDTPSDNTVDIRAARPDVNEVAASCIQEQTATVDCPTRFDLAEDMTTDSVSCLTSQETVPWPGRGSTIERRNDYAMSCLQSRYSTTDCQVSGYYCSSTGQLKHQYNELLSCELGCECIDLLPKPRCLLNIIGNLNCARKRDNKDGFDIVEVPKWLEPQIKDVDMITQETAAVFENLPALRDRNTNFEKRHNYAMWCIHNEKSTRDCQQYFGAYCDSSGRVQFQYEKNDICKVACECIDLNPKPRCLLTLIGTINCARKRDDGQIVWEPVSDAARSAEAGVNDQVIPCGQEKDFGVQINAMDAITSETAAKSDVVPELRSREVHLDKLHNWAMSCIHDPATTKSCHDKYGYCCDPQGMLSTTRDADETCTELCKCVDLGSKPICGFTLVGGAECVTKRGADIADEWVDIPDWLLSHLESTDFIGGRLDVVIEADQLSQLKERAAIGWPVNDYALNCGNKLTSTVNCQKYKGYHCDATGKKVFTEQDDICDLYCECVNLNPKPRCVFTVIGDAQCAAKRDLDGKEEWFSVPDWLARRVMRVDNVEPEMLRIRAELVTAEQNSVDEPEDEAQDENATQIKPNGPLPVVFSSSAATRRSTSSWIRKVSSTCAQLRKRLVEADPANKTQIKLGGVPNPLTSDASSRAAPKWSQLITKAIGKITSALGRKKATKPDINEDSLYLYKRVCVHYQDRAG